MNLLPRIGALTSALILTVTLAAPAEAARYAHRDAAGDVQSETCTETDCTTTGPDATVTEGDIVRSLVDHRARKVVLRAKFRELRPRPGIRVFVARIVTNEGLKRELTVVFDPDVAPRGQMFLSRPNGQDVRCAMGKTVDFTANTIEVRIPRRCLSAPRWVRAGIGYARMTDESTFTLDDAHVTAGTAENLRLSPRVRRG